MSRFTQARNLLDAAIILGVTAVAVGLLAESVRTSLARARENEATVETANAELVRQARRLQTSEERFRSLIDLAVDGILIGDPQGRLIGVNRRMRELTGLTAAELLGRPLRDFFPPEEMRRAPLRYDLVAQGETVVTERLLQRKDGTTVPVEMSSKRMPDGTYHSFFRDITERRRAAGGEGAAAGRAAPRPEDGSGRPPRGRHRPRLQQHAHGDRRQRRRGASRPRAGVPGPPLPHRGGAGRRAGRRPHPPAARLQPEAGRSPRGSSTSGELVENLRPMLAGIVGADVVLDTVAPRRLGLVRLDAGQMEQAVLNLAMNARDAMPGGGRLELGLSDVDLDGERAFALGLAPGPYVALAVSDTGSGMTPEVLQHLFEPFFTTKPSGKGTGLGLAMVYGAVKQNQGAIDVDSHPGRGTTFRLFFPHVAAGSVEATGRVEATARA